MCIHFSEVNYAMIKPYADYLLKTYVNGVFGEYHCYNKAVAACLSRHTAFLQRRNICATLYKGHVPAIDNLTF